MPSDRSARLLLWTILAVALVVRLWGITFGLPHVRVRPDELFVIGAAIFAGTLYAMAVGAPRWLGAVTPVGGTLLILGWLWLAGGISLPMYWTVKLFRKTLQLDKTKEEVSVED